jgi:hypothetical protein
MKGVWKFFKEMIQKDRIIATLAYFGSMGGTLYYSLINPSYINVLILAGLQV